MKVPRQIEATATSMPWLPELEQGTVYEFKGERPLYLFSDGEMHIVPGETTTIFELVKVLDLDGTVQRGDFQTPAYRWTQDDEVHKVASAYFQSDPRTGLGHLNPHECPVCGQMHTAE